jgi:hypothetical protein
MYVRDMGFINYMGNTEMAGSDHYGVIDALCVDGTLVIFLSLERFSQVRCRQMQHARLRRLSDGRVSDHPQVVVYPCRNSFLWQAERQDRCECIVYISIILVINRYS